LRADECPGVPSEPISRSAMDSLITSLIQLFGTISGLALTFLVLLYEAAKRRREAGRQRLLMLIANTWKCPKVQAATGLQPGHELRDRLHEECTQHDPRDESVRELISTIHAKVAELRAKHIQPEVADHLERAHEKLLRNAHDSFENSAHFFTTFPSRSKLVLAVPLTMTSLLVADRAGFNFIAPHLPDWFNRMALLILAVGCLTFIFFAVTHALNDLDKIERGTKHTS
jgi:hypothetical protein